MRLHHHLVATICSVVLLLTGCNTGNGVTTAASFQSNLRVVNVVAGAPSPLVVTLDGNTFVAGLPFEGLTQYQQISAGVSHTAQAAVSGSPNFVITSTILTLGETNYTYVMYGPVGSATARVFSDVTTDPGAGMFNFRAFNAATGSAVVDVYLTPPGASLDSAAPSATGVTLGSLSAFATLPAGTFELRVTPIGSKKVIYRAPPQAFTAGGQYEAIINTRGSSTLVNLGLLNIDTLGTGSFINSLLAQVKVINASLVTSALNVFVDTNLVLSNIPFAGASSYDILPVGTPTLTIEATATPGATLLTTTPSLTPANDTSIVLEGPAGALIAVDFADNNLPPGPGNARVRVVNATADIPSLDVFVNFSKQISGLTSNSGTSSLELSADAVSGTSYQFGFNVAGTSQTVLTVPAVTLLATKTYSIYVAGSGAGLAAAVTQDN